MLIDSGASHNYVPSYIVRANNWNVIDCQNSEVKLPNGAKLNTSTICKLNIKFVQSPIAKTITFYVVPLESTFILGSSFLHASKCTLNFESKQLSFPYRHSNVSL